MGKRGEKRGTTHSAVHPPARLRPHNEVTGTVLEVRRRARTSWLATLSRIGIGVLMIKDCFFEGPRAQLVPLSHPPGFLPSFLHSSLPPVLPSFLQLPPSHFRPLRLNFSPRPAWVCSPISKQRRARLSIGACGTAALLSAFLVSREAWTKVLFRALFGINRGKTRTGLKRIQMQR